MRSSTAAGAGAHLRHQLDRESEEYKQLYTQRTMVERINSQTGALDIIHPKLHHDWAIANSNTLTYVLINLRRRGLAASPAVVLAASRDETSGRGELV